MKTLSDPDTNVRLEAALALHDIEPEIFTNLPPVCTVGEFGSSHSVPQITPGPQYFGSV